MRFGENVKAFQLAKDTVESDAYQYLMKLAETGMIGHVSVSDVALDECDGSVDVTIRIPSWLLPNDLSAFGGV